MQALPLRCRSRISDLGAAGYVHRYVLICHALYDLGAVDYVYRVVIGLRFLILALSIVYTGAAPRSET